MRTTQRISALAASRRRRWPGRRDPRCGRSTRYWLFLQPIGRLLGVAATSWSYAPRSGPLMTVVTRSVPMGHPEPGRHQRARLPCRPRSLDRTVQCRRAARGHKRDGLSAAGHTTRSSLGATATATSSRSLTLRSSRDGRLVSSLWISVGSIRSACRIAVITRSPCRFARDGHRAGSSADSVSGDHSRLF